MTFGGSADLFVVKIRSFHVGLLSSCGRAAVSDAGVKRPPGKHVCPVCLSHSYQPMLRCLLTLTSIVQIQSFHSVQTSEGDVVERKGLMLAASLDQRVRLNPGVSAL